MELSATSVFGTPSSPSINHIQILQGLACVQAKIKLVLILQLSLFGFMHSTFLGVD